MLLLNITILCNVVQWIFFGVSIDLQINTEVVGCQPPCLLSMKYHFHIFFFFPEGRYFWRYYWKAIFLSFEWNRLHQIIGIFQSISLGKSIMVLRVLSSLIKSTFVGLFGSTARASQSCKHSPFVGVCSLIWPHRIASSLFSEVVAAHHRFWCSRGTFNVLFSRMIPLYYLFQSTSFQKLKSKLLNL